MKKTSTPKQAGRAKGSAGEASEKGAQDDMMGEYRFDYRKAKPNRFAARLSDRVAVVLDPDVAAVFKSSESVNDLLRSVIHAMPESKRGPSN